MQLFVVDISKYDRDISIEKLKSSDVSAVIVKCGGGDDGLYEDSWFERNYKKCAEAGMPTGVYYYSAATDEDTALREAEHCLSILNGRHLDYPVWMDVEERTHQQMCTNQPGKLGRTMAAFCSRIEQAGYKAGIYSWKWLLDPCSENISPYDRWVCAWTRSKPSGQVDMWQFGGESNEIRSTSVAGYPNVDQSYCYKDYSGGSEEPSSPSQGYSENRFPCKYRVTFPTGVNVRDMPSTRSGKVVAEYEPGESCAIDGITLSDGRVWGSYVGASSGKRRYVALGLTDIART